MSISHNYLVYIMTNKHKNVLYVGVTNDLERRVYEHEIGEYKGFTKKYNCHYLIYYEHFTHIEYAIDREKEIKKWRPEKKDSLISLFNPDWRFLNQEIVNL
ncbi:MAG: endonuclease [Bacteroidetes bacterium HGW-Bacteroidetes-16]|nr:MAG: endonuclease [Bacteroidetes bacterium HGW-Bacteroidetes-16]